VRAVHISRGPSIEVKRMPDRERWCFYCRSRLAHDPVAYDYPSPTYYGPVCVRECSCCGRHRTAFPGTF
jgi:hypothetical protein